MVSVWIAVRVASVAALLFIGPRLAHASSENAKAFAIDKKIVGPSF